MLHSSFEALYWLSWVVVLYQSPNVQIGPHPA
jgi:hypothetical protein